MNGPANVSDFVVRRLVYYKRVLEELDKNNIAVISSQKLSKLTGLSASCIRQDLSSFGHFGVSGSGYNVKTLLKNINLIIGLDKGYTLIVIGAGHLGQALVNNPYLMKSGFSIIAMFDINPRLIGFEICGVEVYDYENLNEFLMTNKVDIAIITTNTENAAEVAEKLEAAQVEGIWNFTTADLSLLNNTIVQNVHLSDSLHQLSYHINMQSSKSQSR